MCQIYKMIYKLIIDRYPILLFDINGECYKSRIYMFLSHFFLIELKENYRRALIGIIRGVVNISPPSRCRFAWTVAARRAYYTPEIAFTFSSPLRLVNFPYRDA